jgi:hypothetical protein
MSPLSYPAFTISWSLFADGFLPSDYVKKLKDTFGRGTRDLWPEIDLENLNIDEKKLLSPFIWHFRAHLLTSEDLKLLEEKQKSGNTLVADDFIPIYLEGTIKPNKYKDIFKFFENNV